MKKTLILGAMLAGALGANAQGTVNFNESGTYTIHIYGPQVASPGTSVSGNGPNDIPAGSTVYDPASEVGGSSTGTGLGNGNMVSVELYGAAGSGDPLSSLQPLSQYTGHISIKPGGAGQFVAAAQTGTDPGIPGSVANGNATVALAAWFNGGGAYTSIVAAQAAGQPAAFSDTATINGTGGFGTPPTTPPFIGVNSFSLTGVPEPSTIALGVMGASAFLMRRRMSK